MTDLNIKTVFMGTPDFSCYIADALLESGFDVVAVVTQPDKEAGRGKKLKAPPAKEWAIAHGIPYLQPIKARDPEFIAEIAEIKPQLIVTAAFGQIIPKEILDMPEYGCINVHASLLPKYRGASPIQQALFNGDKETGISLQYMAEKMDEGDVIIQRTLAIEETDNCGILFDRLALLGKETIYDYASLVANGKPEATPQNHNEATYCKKVAKEEGNINWADTAEHILNTIRAMTPSPGAYSFLNGKRIKIISATRDDNDISDTPAKIAKADKTGITIQTGKGTITITQLQPEGKSVQTVRDFLNGNKLTADMAFERNL